MRNVEQAVMHHLVVEVAAGHCTDTGRCCYSVTSWMTCNAIQQVSLCLLHHSCNVLDGDVMQYDLILQNALVGMQCSFVAPVSYASHPVDKLRGDCLQDHAVLHLLRSKTQPV